MNSRFLDALAVQVMLGDGAMGTELIARGARWEKSTSELNLSHPDLVLTIHREYVEAGAEFLRTNTFTANRLRMPADQVRSANAEGVRVARAAAGKGFVGGSVGPLDDVEASDEDKASALREQCHELASAGCDALVLETFGSVPGWTQAIAIAKEQPLPVLAHTFRTDVSISRKALEGAGAHVVGTNCATFPDAWKILVGFREGLLSAFPSPGPTPEMKSPEAFAGGAITMVQKLGVRLIGGCCGTTPDHIRAIRLLMGGKG